MDTHEAESTQSGFELPLYFRSFLAGALGSTGATTGAGVSVLGTTGLAVSGSRTTSGALPL